MSKRLARILVALAALLLGLAFGAGSGAFAATTRGGCQLSSASCYFFDVSMSGTGSGTYATLDGDSGFTGRIVCHYGNDEQTGVCGWGYDVPAGGAYSVPYRLTPDKGSQACDTQHCYGGTIDNAYSISGNYFDPSWRFELIDPIQIDVTVDGGGVGKVTSDPPGIDCPADCQDLFAARTAITLTARPQANYVLAGWSGACTGTKPICTINSSTAVAVTATFKRAPTAPPNTEPPAEATEPPTEPPTEAPPEVPATEAPASGGPTAAFTAAATTEALSTQPAETADPAPTGSSSGGGNLPIVIVLVVVLIGLGGGAIFAFRRGGGAAAS